jgi:hypothetical protein
MAYVDTPKLLSNFDNYYLLHQPATLTSNLGRAKGGLIIMFRKAIFMLTTILHHSNHNVTLLLTCTDSAQQIIIASYYIQPGAELDNPTRQELDTLAEHLSHFPNTPAIIGGDFNGRVGLLGEVLPELDIPTPQTRQSKDAITNTRGEIIMEVMDELDLILTNGRLIGDESGDFTFISGQGKSTIDLVFCSEDVIRGNATLHITPLPVSHHSLVTLTWTHLCSACKQNNEVISLSWNSSRAEMYQAQICSILPNIPDLMTPKYTELHDCVIQAATNSRMARMIPLEKIHNKPRYNKECHNARAQLRLSLYKAKQSN